MHCGACIGFDVCANRYTEPDKRHGRLPEVGGKPIGEHDLETKDRPVIHSYRRAEPDATEQGEYPENH